MRNLEMGRHRGPVLVALVLGFLVLAPIFPLAGGQGPAQNDAGQGRDAPNQREQALLLQPNQRYTGTLVRDQDESDWYAFDISTIGGAGGRPVVDLYLQGLPSSDFDIELWAPGDAPLPTGTGPTATGEGPRSVKTIHRSIGSAERWSIHVFTAGTGRHSGDYELTFVLRTENDGGANRDAGDGQASGTVRLDALPEAGTVLRGEFAPGDPVDVYRFPVPQPNSVVLAGLHFSAAHDLTLSAAPFTGPALSPPVVKSGPRFVTLFQELVGPGDWLVQVRNEVPNLPASYVLTLALNPPTPDAGTGLDAGDGPDSTDHELTPGIHRGRLTAESNADRIDVYKLSDVAVGQTLFLGAGSHTGALMIPQLQLRLIHVDAQDRETIAGVSRICGNSGGFFFTADRPGTADGPETWFAEVREVGNAQESCGPALGPRNGDYAISFAALDQGEGGGNGGDAPKSITAAPNLPAGLEFRGALDSVDLDDTYSLGNMASGGVVRATAASPAGLAFRLDLFSPQGTLLSAATSSSGRARLYNAVGDGGQHFLRVTQTVGEDSPAIEADYWLSVQVLPNAPPIPVALSAPSNPVEGGGDVGRNTVRLSWSEAVDLDFARYEVHGSKQADFSPSGATRFESLSARNQTNTTVRGLEPGATYTFLVRVVDESGSSSDSNRRTVTLRSGPLNNQAPRLSDGRVTPDEGTPSTLFRFEVTYTDADNDTPVERRVYVDGIGRDMQGQGNAWSQGVRFTHETTLNPGQHSFFFQFDDGDGPVRYPSTGSRAGPNVTTTGNRPPTAQASASPSSGDAPLEVRFDVDASDPDGDPLAYSWDFDNADGIQHESAEKSPRHTYQNRGTYTATVRVSDSAGATSTSSVTVNVHGTSNKAPSADPTADPDSGLAPLRVEFDAGARDEDGTIASYRWDFDNSDGIQQESTQASPSHVYSTAGSYVATVTVRDNGGSTATGSVLVVVRSGDNHPPSVIVLAEPQEGAAPLRVNFTANAADADGDTVTITWDFDIADGIGSDAIGPFAEHTYPGGGTFTAMAVVKDPSGATATGTATIRVTGEPGAGPAVFIVAEPTEGKAPLDVEFEADTSRMSTEPESYSWDFGDGTEPASGRNVSHTFERAGTFTVTLRVTDDRGVEWESTVVIRVEKGGGTPGLGWFAAVAGILIAGTILATVAWLRGRHGGPK